MGIDHSPRLFPTLEGTLSYTYDAAGNLASMTSGDGNVSVSYTWDSLNRLSTVTDNRLTGTSNTTTYTYDTANNVVKVAYPNGVQATLNYDTLNRLTSLTTPNTGYLYTLGPTGTRSDVTELTGRAITWNYDGIYRLTGETISSAPSKVNGSVAYGLDPVGNRLMENSAIPGIGSGSYSYGADDQLSTESYDQNGNTISTGGKSFSYDSQNELVAMNGGAVSIIYDAFGNRVAKTASGVTTRYLVDDLNPTGYPQVMDELTNGIVTRTYTYGVRRISEDQIINGTWTPSFYGYDGLGNVRQLTNAAGAITDTNEYNAFGNLLNFTGGTPNVYLYRGEQYDSDLGLYYLRARYYNPLTGRFMSRDPEDGDVTDPSTLHKYLYADGDPVNEIDPSGHEAAEEQEELVAPILKLAARPSNAGFYGKAFAAGAGAGGGMYALTAAIICSLDTDAAAIRAYYSHLGLLQTIEFMASGCSAESIPTQPKSGGGPGSPPKTPPPPNPPCTCQPGWHMHHLLPQNPKMKAWFKSHGIKDINDPQFLVCVPPGAHIGKGGLHPNGWNPEWQAFMNEFPDATKQMILEQLNKMKNEWRFQKPLNSCEN